MKRLLFVAVSLAGAGALASAQESGFGIVGGLAYSASSPTTSVTPYTNRGWGIGITSQFASRTPSVAFRFDASFTQLGEFQSSTNNPNCPTDPSVSCGSAASAAYSYLGGAANVLWYAVGAGQRAKLYLIGGLGYYAVRSNVSSPSAPQVSSATTLGAVGYNAGFGLGFSRLFLEARLMVIMNGAMQYGSTTKSDLAMWPVTLGFTF